MAISKDEVNYVAKLSRIKLEDKTLDNFTSQLAKILKYMEKLDQLNTKDTAPTSHVLGLTNVVRKDENIKSLPTAEALKNAPNKEDGHFKVPKIIQ